MNLPFLICVLREDGERYQFKDE